MTGRMLVTGTRLGWHPDHLRHLLSHAYGYLVAYSGPQITLVHGDGQGVDQQAARIWQACNFGPIEPHPANWNAWGKSAGPRRNLEMVAQGADLCLAFIHPTSKGTLHCAAAAEQASITTWRYEYGKGWPM